jgi:hypothetical protein
VQINYEITDYNIAKLFLTEVTGVAERKRDSDDISESEFSRQAVKKAAERFEKVASEESSQRMPPPSLSSLGARGRSKSIGHSLAQKLQEADEELVKPVLPWAVSTDDQVSRGHVNTLGQGGSINDVTQFLIILLFSTKALVLLSQNAWYPSPLWL